MRKHHLNFRVGITVQNANAKQISWSREAEKRLKRIPFFVRPWVRKRAEAEALSRGETQVSTELLEELRKKQHD